GSTKYVADEAVYKERGDSLVRAATTVSSLETEQDSGNIDVGNTKSVGHFQVVTGLSSKLV
ncbi:hypothetical protein Tco_0667681, partial [Tanacetum coccineum]